MSWRPQDVVKRWQLVGLLPTGGSDDGIPTFQMTRGLEVA